MTQPNETYKIERTCTVCGHAEKLFVTKRQAAFELIDIDKALGKKCRMCSLVSFRTTYQSPELDIDLLNEWAINSDLHLMQQDEEILLAEKAYLEMILEVVDTIGILDHKRNLLIDALCIIVYDNSIDDNRERDEQLKERVIKELNQRQDKLQLADNSIMDYIKVVVYPQLDFSSNNAV